MGFYYHCTIYMYRYVHIIWIWILKQVLTLKIVRCLFLNLSLPLCSSKLNTSINFFTKDESFIFTNIGFSVSNISDSVLSNLGCSDCLAYIFISLKQKIHSTIYNLLYSDNRVFCSLTRITRWVIQWYTTWFCHFRKRRTFITISYGSPLSEKQ